MADLAAEHDPQTPGQDDGNSNAAGGGQSLESRPNKRPRAQDDDDDDDEKPGRERRKIDIKFIQDKSRRHITFSKRKAGIMKKVCAPLPPVRLQRDCSRHLALLGTRLFDLFTDATKAYELSVLTGTQVLLLVVSETGLVYTFTTPKLQPLVTKPEGKNLIQVCLS